MPLPIARMLLAAAALVAAVLMAPAAGPAHAAPAPEPGVAIFNGEDATDAPWEAYLLTQSAEGFSSCTGIVIGQRWILTAAHCVSYTEGAKAGQYFDDLATLVVTGNTDLSVGTEALKPALAEAYYISGDWNPAVTGFLGDFALLRLDRDTRPELGIVPARDDQADAFAGGVDGVVSGWGLNEANESPDILQSVGAPVLAAEACAAFGSGFFPIAMLCSGDDGPPPKGTCRGDSGGPLSAASASGAPIVGGITSFGAFDCNVQPAGFTRISVFAEVISESLAADPVAPLIAPEIPAINVAATSGTTATATATLEANGGATNLEVDLVPTLPAAPLVRGTRGGSSSDARSVGFDIGGLAPGVTYDWSSHASSIFGRAAGPTGQLTTPGEQQLLGATPETTRCLALEDDAAPAKEAGTIRLTRAQLATNQRIGQAALRRLNAIEDWINAGITAADICGGSLGSGVLSEIELGRAGDGPAAAAPSPRPLSVKKPNNPDSSRISLDAGQMRTNQRIYQAALRRARALRDRLSGGLTGGDIQDGALGWGALPPGAMMIRFGAGEQFAPSVTQIAPPNFSQAGEIREASVGQLKINQRIAQAAVREANALRDEILTGLTAENFLPTSISSRDFEPAIAAKITGNVAAAPAASAVNAAEAGFTPKPLRTGP